MYLVLISDLEKYSPDPSSIRFARVVPTASPTELSVSWMNARDQGGFVRAIRIQYGWGYADQYVDVSNTTEQYTLMNLQPNTNYVIHIYAYNRAGKSLVETEYARTGDETIESGKNLVPILITFFNSLFFVLFILLLQLILLLPILLP